MEPPRDPTQRQGRADSWAQRLWALYEVGQAIAASMDLDRLLAVVVDKACSLMEVDRCGLFLVESRDATGLILRCREARGLPEEFFRRIRFGPGESMAGQVIADGQTLWTDDLQADPRFILSRETRDLVAAHNIHGILTAPLMAGGGALGVISVYRDAGVGFAPDEADLLSAFALQVAIALENARLLAEGQRTLRQTRALFEVSKALASSLDTQTALDLIVQQGADLTGARQCVLWASAGVTPDGVDLVARAQAGFDPAAVAGLGALATLGTIGRVLRERAPAWTSDLFADPATPVTPAGTAFIRQHDIGASLGVPVETREAFVGVLSVFRPRGSVFTDDEVTLLWSFADLAAIALENARLVAGEREKGQLAAMLAMARMAGDRILNPLNVMAMSAQLLARGLPDGHAGQELVTRILDNSHRIERIVAQMNRITRYQTREFSPGLFELELEKVAGADPPEASGSPPAVG